MERYCFNSFLLKWLLFITWGVTILSMSLLPDPPTVNHRFWGWDKFEHAAAYSLLTVFAGWAFGYFKFSFRNRWLLAVGVAVGVGALLEVLQGLFTKTRTAEFADLLADAVGATAIYLLAMVLGKVFPTMKRS